MYFIAQSYLKTTILNAGVKTGLLSVFVILTNFVSHESKHFEANKDNACADNGNTFTMISTSYYYFLVALSIVCGYNCTAIETMKVWAIIWHF